MLYRSYISDMLMFAVNAFVAYATNGKEDEIIKERYINRVEWVKAFIQDDSTGDPETDARSAIEQAHDLFAQMKRKGGRKNRAINIAGETDA